MIKGRKLSLLLQKLQESRNTRAPVGAIFILRQLFLGHYVDVKNQINWISDLIGLFLRYRKKARD